MKTEIDAIKERNEKIRTLVKEKIDLVRQRDAAREAAQIGLSWLSELEHLGSIVDQERLSADLGKVTAALGWVRRDDVS